MTDEASEDELDSWLAKEHALYAYSGKHPEYRIPQLDLLTAIDWLDVSAGKMDTEADYRRALARLRLAGKEKTEIGIASALTQAIAANGGKPPTDTSALLPYLPAGYDPAILAELKVNPSGMTPGLKTTDGPAQTFYIVDKEVDIWDGAIYYSPAGISTRWLGAEESSVVNAIAQFTQTTGAPPTNAAQLMQYKGVNAMAPSTLAEFFKALTTKPQ